MHARIYEYTCMRALCLCARTHALTAVLPFGPLVPFAAFLQSVQNTQYRESARRPKHDLACFHARHHTAQCSFAASRRVSGLSNILATERGRACDGDEA
eukprot:4584786-Pleurochrysis_carterae.AAC.1